MEVEKHSCFNTSKNDIGYGRVIEQTIKNNPIKPSNYENL